MPVSSHQHQANASKSKRQLKELAIVLIRHQGPGQHSARAGQGG